MEILATVVILVSFGVGAYYQFFSKKVDATAEQVAEKVLEKYEIKYDFSAQKKKELKDQQETEKEDK